MTQVDETTQEEYYEQMPFSAEEWAQTPRAVQEFVVSTVARLQVVEAELATLRERVNQNSSNSSRPPSSDGPGVPPKTSKRAKSGRKRGAQKGHKGTTRKLVSLDQVKESFDVKPEECSRCGHPLSGTDSKPYRHQVTEIPPVVAEVTEYRLHTLACSECEAKTQSYLLVCPKVLLVLTYKRWSHCQAVTIT